MAKPTAPAAIRGVISKPKFDGGVLVGCTIVKDAEHLAGNKAWATVVTLDAGTFAGADYAKVYHHAVMTALRSVRVDGADDLVDLCTGKRQRPWEKLVVDWCGTLAEATALANATALPKLRELEVRIRNDDGAKMIQILAAAKLDRLWLELSSRVTDIGAIVAVARATRLELFDDQHLGTKYVFEGNKLAVAVPFSEKSYWPDAIFAKLETMIGSLPKTITSIKITPKPPVKKIVNKKRFAALERP